MDGKSPSFKDGILISGDNILLGKRIGGGKVVEEASTTPLAI